MVQVSYFLGALYQIWRGGESEVDVRSGEKYCICILVFIFFNCIFLLWSCYYQVYWQCTLLLPFSSILHPTIGLEMVWKICSIYITYMYEVFMKCVAYVSYTNILFCRHAGKGGRDSARDVYSISGLRRMRAQA